MAGFNNTLAQAPGDIFIIEQHLNIDRLYREWRMKVGNQMSAKDLDGLVSEMVNKYGIMNEYDNSTRSFGLIEFKHWRESYSKIYKILNNPSAERWLADAAQIPLFIVRYYPPLNKSPVHGKYKWWMFDVYAVNEWAKLKLPEQSKHMSEREYVEFLFHLRNKTPDESYLSRFKTKYLPTSEHLYK